MRWSVRVFSSLIKVMSSNSIENAAVSKLFSESFFAHCSLIQLDGLISTVARRGYSIKKNGIIWQGLVESGEDALILSLVLGGFFVFGVLVDKQ